MRLNSINKDEVRELLDKYISSYQKEDYYRWAIIEKEFKSCIGQIAIFLVDNKNHFCEIEYCIHINFLMKNAENFGVSDQIIGVKSGVPESLLPEECFDYAYSTTTLEMVRGYTGLDSYIASLKEIHRILKKGGIFGLGEPMHFNIPVPDDLAPHVQNNMWEKCFATIEETEKAVRQAGFKILQAGYCEEADTWWKEFSDYAPEYDAVEDDTIVIKNNNNRWLSFGYVIAVK